MTANDLSIRILKLGIGIYCPDPDLRQLVVGNWGHMADPDAQRDLDYRITRGHRSCIAIERQGQPTFETHHVDEFLYQLEADITVELQKRHTDLYFLHSAATELDGKAYLFAAESGAGKSTMAWGLLHHGFRYLSDELAPLDLVSMRVQAYPRALCLKTQPPRSFPLPAGAFTTTSTLHIPVPSLPTPVYDNSCPLAAVFFVKYSPTADVPRLQHINAAGAAARLYANALNQLAHPNAGLDAAVRIAESVPSFLLESAELAATCELVRNVTQADSTLTGVKGQQQRPRHSFSTNRGRPGG